jgi:hypothetical protein
LFHNPEPESVDLNIDGATDKCSKGEDINFQFVGFAVEGKVCTIFLISSGITSTHIVLKYEDQWHVVSKHEEQ